MTGQEMMHRLADLSGELDLLFTDPLWTERADAGLDEDGPDNAQAMLGEAADVLQHAVRKFERKTSSRQQMRDRLRGESGKHDF